MRIISVLFVLSTVLFVSPMVRAEGPEDGYHYIECESAYHNMDVYMLEEGNGFITWTHKLFPDGDSLARNAVWHVDQSRDLVVFEFHDGALFLDGALARGESLGGEAQTRFSEGPPENYRCIRR